MLILIKVSTFVHTIKNDPPVESTKGGSGLIPANTKRYTENVVPNIVVPIRTRKDLAGRKNATRHANGLAILSRMADKWNALLPYGSEE